MPALILSALNSFGLSAKTTRPLGLSGRGDCLAGNQVVMNLQVAPDQVTQHHWKQMDYSGSQLFSTETSYLSELLLFFSSFFSVRVPHLTSLKIGDSPNIGGHACRLLLGGLKALALAGLEFDKKCGIVTLIEVDSGISISRYAGVVAYPSDNCL